MGRESADEYILQILQNPEKIKHFPLGRRLRWAILNDDYQFDTHAWDRVTGKK